MKNWGRFTVRGSVRIERELAELADSIATAASATLSSREYRTLVMMGGYGRGEGGVDRRSGAERPHNNIDLLLVTRGVGRSDGDVKRTLERAVAPLSAQAGIGIDIGTVSHLRLAWAPCRIIWYDTRFGHKPIAGETEYFTRLSRFSADRILPSDARDLLVNRGTLLLLNELMLEQGSLSAAGQHALVRHAVKAIIGYGDALLYFLGAYHWSYVEKHNRLLAHRSVPEAFKDLYARAFEYRLEPSTDIFTHVGDPDWTAEVRRELAAIHVMCEAARLGRPGLDWRGYPEAALSRLARDSWRRPVDAALAAHRAVRRWPVSTKRAGLPRTLRMASARDRLALAFPAVAYGLVDPGSLELARMALAAPSHDPAVLRRAFLSEWGRSGDVNFEQTLARLGLGPLTDRGVA